MKTDVECGRSSNQEGETVRRIESKTMHFLADILKQLK